MKFLIDNWLLILCALVSGGMLIWPLLRKSGGGELGVSGAVHLINRERGVLVDVRAAEEYAAGHPVGARNVPLDQLEAKLSGAVKNKGLPVLLICASGRNAQRAVAVAKNLGYEKAQAVAGGLKAWREANLPVEKA